MQKNSPHYTHIDLIFLEPLLKVAHHRLGFDNCFVIVIATNVTATGPLRGGWLLGDSRWGWHRGHRGHTFEVSEVVTAYTWLLHPTGKLQGWRVRVIQTFRCTRSWPAGQSWGAARSWACLGKAPGLWPWHGPTWTWAWLSGHWPTWSKASGLVLETTGPRHRRGWVVFGSSWQSHGWFGSLTHRIGSNWLVRSITCATWGHLRLLQVCNYSSSPTAPVVTGIIQKSNYMCTRVKLARKIMMGTL